MQERSGSMWRKDKPVPRKRKRKRTRVGKNRGRIGR
jgi:hypothetical protein